MLASFPASMVNQKAADLGIPNRFNLNSFRFNSDGRENAASDYRKPVIEKLHFLTRHDLGLTLLSTFIAGAGFGALVGFWFGLKARQ
jgi:hypothetical protein